ncbi:MAG: aldo/keto reductase [Anaerolineae bacterium]|nr:aldo/keto reductase [Anaerolineae bacterium]
MEKRILGRSGIEVSSIGMGCWAIGGPWTFSNGEASWPAGWGKIDDKESLRALQAGLDLGITFFDTAANYGAGHSERILGQAVAGRRDKVVIATKFGFIVDTETKHVRVDDAAIIANIHSDCEKSLQRLGTDYIDIYQLHQGSYAEDKAPLVMDALEELVKAGKIRWYGWSTDHPGRARIFAQGEHCTSIQFDLNVFRDNPETREICAEFNLGGINKSPLSRGLLTGKFNPDSTFPKDDIRHSWSFKDEDGAKHLDQLEAVRGVLTANGHTLAQASLAYIWALDERMVPIPGFRSVQQVQENAKAMQLGPLSSEQVHAVTQLLSGFVESEG